MRGPGRGSFHSVDLRPRVPRRLLQENHVVPIGCTDDYLRLVISQHSMTLLLRPLLQLIPTSLIRLNIAIVA